MVQFELSPVTGRHEQADEAPMPVAFARQVRTFSSTYPKLEAADAARRRLPDDVLQCVTMTAEIDELELCMLVHQHWERMQFVLDLIAHDAVVGKGYLSGLDYHSGRLTDLERLLDAISIRGLYDATARMFDPKSECAELEKDDDYKM